MRGHSKYFIVFRQPSDYVQFYIHSPRQWENFKFHFDISTLILCLLYDVMRWRMRRSEVEEKFRNQMNNIENSLNWQLSKSAHDSLISFHPFRIKFKGTELTLPSITLLIFYFQYLMWAAHVVLSSTSSTLHNFTVRQTMRTIFPIFPISYATRWIDPHCSNAFHSR